MNYQVGDEVVCIDAKPVWGHATRLKAGNAYHINDIKQRPCCGAFVVDVGMLGHELRTVCRCGLRNEGDGYKGAWRFIKLPGVTARTEVTSEAEAI